MLVVDPVGDKESLRLGGGSGETRLVGGVRRDWLKLWLEPCACVWLTLWLCPFVEDKLVCEWDTSVRW